MNYDAVKIMIITKINEPAQVVSSPYPFVLNVRSQKSGELQWNLIAGTWDVEEKFDFKHKKYRVRVRKVK